MQIIMREIAFAVAVDLYGICLLSKISIVFALCQKVNRGTRKWEGGGYFKEEKSFVKHFYFKLISILKIFLTGHPSRKRLFTKFGNFGPVNFIVFIIHYVAAKFCHLLSLSLSVLSPSQFYLVSLF